MQAGYGALPDKAMSETHARNHDRDLNYSALVPGAGRHGSSGPNH